MCRAQESVKRIVTIVKLVNSMSSSMEKESEAQTGSETSVQQSLEVSVDEVTSKVADLSVSKPAAADPEEMPKTKHPWEKKVPEERRLSATISDSDKYKQMIPNEYRTSTSSGRLSMDKIIANFPSFLRDLSPYVSTQNPRRKESDSQFEAQSVEIASSASSNECFVPHYIHIDCDGYCVESLVPDSCMQYFESEYEVIKQIKEDFRESHRWVFIPSYCRASCGLFDWSEASEAGDLSETHQVIVVRPSQFKEYQRVCESTPNLILVSLPVEINGIGYARNWIQKMAGSLGLRYIWMMDDSVLWFKEFNPEHPKELRKVSFAESFRILEKVAKKDDLAAFGPRVYNGLTQSKLNKPFTYKPPRGVVFLDLKLLSDKKIMYRSQLTILEDMIFGYECDKVGLRVCVSNRIHFKDMPWNKTGTASSISSPAGVTPSSQQPSENRESTPQSKLQPPEAKTPLSQHPLDAKKKLFPET